MTTRKSLPAKMPLALTGAYGCAGDEGTLNIWEGTLIVRPNGLEPVNEGGKPAPMRGSADTGRGRTDKGGGLCGSSMLLYCRRRDG